MEHQPVVMKLDVLTCRDQLALCSIMAIGVAWWTWNKSRIALKSHDDGEGRLVLLPAYQVIPYNSLSQHDA
jgi:hypothetical protein